MKQHICLLLIAVVCVAFHACSDSTSNPLDDNTGTLESAPTITVIPRDTTGRVGRWIYFDAKAIGNPLPQMRWQMNAGAGYEDLDKPGGPLSLWVESEEWDGYQVRAVFWNKLGTVFSRAATLTVLPESFVTITNHPQAQATCEGVKTVFAVGYTISTPSANLTFQWQVGAGTGWQDIPGATDETFSIAPNSDHDGNQYRVTISDEFGVAATSNPATLSVLNAVVITLQPTNIGANENASVTFASQAIGSESLEVQWQMSVDGGITYSDLVGETQNTLIVNAQPSLNGALFRAAYTNSCSSVFTDSAMLTVL